MPVPRLTEDGAPVAFATEDDGRTQSPVYWVRNLVWNAGTSTWDRMTQPGGGGGGGGGIVQQGARDVTAQAWRMTLETAGGVGYDARDRNWTVTETVPVSGPLTDAQLRASAVPISAATLPLPAGAAQEHVGATSFHSTRLTDGTVFYDARARTWFLTSGNDSVTIVPSGTQAVNLSQVGGVLQGVTNPLPVRLSDGTIFLLGQKTMVGSIPIVLASDQSAVPENLTQVGGVAIAAKAASTFGVAALPVWPNAVQRDTYYASAARIASGALVANTPVKILSIEHAAVSTKTVRIRRIIISGYVSTAGAATAGSLDWFLSYGTAASSAGTLFTATKANAASVAAEAVVKTLPTIVAATVLYGPLVTNAWNATGATIGSLVPFTVFYDWQENGETVPLTLRAGVLEALALSVQSQSATLVITCSVKIMFTEE